jgi:hypothetical protein
MSRVEQPPDPRPASPAAEPDSDRVEQLTINDEHVSVHDLDAGQTIEEPAEVGRRAAEAGLRPASTGDGLIPQTRDSSRGRRAELLNK